jgi:surfactin synthase thioesterase subunit/NAD(P)-dependent dehydrogenase (short-subunit alcohol dehydrogenase family)
MLGGKIAQWLVEHQGVRHLVLTGRRGAQSAAQDTLQALVAHGAHVHVLPADVSVEADVQRVLAEIAQHLPPLKGIIHCAGVLDDGILSQLDWPKFTRATAPKIKGSWLLHHHTQHLDLDCFVLHSSLLSLTGSAGQANYVAGNAFLDALVAHRRALGLPAMAINWGPWDEAGLATVSGARGAAIWRAQGVRYISPADGIRLFAALLDSGVAHAAVTITDWGTYLAQFPEPPPLYAELAREVRTRGQELRRSASPDVQTRLRQAPQQEHRAILIDYMRQEVMATLGFVEPIDVRQPLRELGLDSLMAVQVANRLEAALGDAVPLVILIQGASLEQLVDALFPDLVPGTDAACPAETASPTAPGVLRECGKSAEMAGHDWLVFPRPHTAARTRLFCFPFAGGGAATYRSWADALHPAIEVVAIDPPGRARRIHEAPVHTYAEFLEALVPAMLPWLDKPCAFFGHCLGGLSVFETARTLLREPGLPLKHIFVSGSRPPHRIAREGLFEEQLFAHILQLDQFDPFLPIHAQPDDVFAAVIRRFNIGATEDFLANPELRHLLLPAIRADFAMASRYRFTPETPWHVPITCFMGLDDPYVTHEDAVAWSRYTRVAFRLHIRETAHFMVVDDKEFLLETINRELGV